MIVNVREVTPSICISARSINSPTQNPATAPTVEPHSNPVNATSRGERSTLTPNTGTSETTLIWTNTITIESSATRHTASPEARQRLPQQKRSAEMHASTTLPAGSSPARSSPATFRLGDLATLGFFFWAHLTRGCETGSQIVQRRGTRSGGVSEHLHVFETVQVGKRGDLDRLEATLFVDRGDLADRDALRIKRVARLEIVPAVTT